MTASLGPAIGLTGFKAGADLSDAQFCPVQFASTAGEVTLAVAVDDLVAGILQNDPEDGENAEIIALGHSKGRLAAAVPAGSFLTPNSTGYLKAAATTNDRIVGMALATSVSAGEIHPILVCHGNL